MAEITVPQQEGSIAISIDGDPPQEYPVTAGVVDVPADQINRFLGLVPGSALKAEAPPSAPPSAAPTPAKEG